MESWYKVATSKVKPEGRSFNPDEFADSLEQAVSGAEHIQNRDPVQCSERTCFTRALRDDAAVVVRRLAGKTENTVPVLSLDYSASVDQRISKASAMC
jgi:predicted AAA+ superfamily ATPase